MIGARRQRLFFLVAGLAVLCGAPLPAADIDPANPLAGVDELIQRGQLDAAEAALRQAMASQSSASLHDVLGVVLSRQGRMQEAERQFQQALEMDPELLDGHQHLARLYLLQQRRRDAVTQLRKAARLGPLERDLAMTLASIEMAAGDSAAAARQLASVAERFESVQALLQLARLATAGGDQERALAALQKARELAPASEEVLATNARTSLAAGLPVPAIIVLEPLVRMHPMVAEYAYLEGVARMQIADLAGSVEALQRSLELEPDRALTLLGLGLSLNHQKRHAEARDVLARSLILDPENVDCLASLAEAEAGLSQLDAAERYANRALAQDSSHATANLALGLTRMKQGRYAEARDALEATLAVDPRSHRSHYQLSQAYSRLGDRDKSREHVERYRQLLQEDKDQLAELRQTLGLPTGAEVAP